MNGGARRGGPRQGGNPPNGPPPGGNAGAGNAGLGQGDRGGFHNQPKKLGQYHVHTTGTTRRERKIVKRAVNVVTAAVPRYLKWSEHDIT